MAQDPTVKGHLLGLQLACWLLAAPAEAQWVPNGAPVCTDPGVQGIPSIAADGSGGAFVAWRDSRNRDATGADVYAQRISALGFIAPGWPPNGLPICTATSSQDQRAMTVDGVGGMYICWSDARDYFVRWNDVYLQRVTGDGAIAPGWTAGGNPVCTDSGDVYAPLIASDGAGGAFVVWRDYRRAPSGYLSFDDTIQVDIYAQRITASGEIAAGWPPDGRPLRTARGSIYGVSLLPDGLGGLFLVWSDARDFLTAGYDLYALRITPQGDPAAGWPADGMPVCTAPGLQYDAVLVSDDQGGFFVAWTDARATPPGEPNYLLYTDTYATRITGSGTIAAGWPQNGLALCTAESIQWFPRIASDGAGGAIVFWGDYRNYFTYGTAEDIYAQRVLASGQVTPGWTADGVAVSRAPAWQRAHALVANGAGGALLAFVTYSGPGDRVFAQHVTAAGGIARGWNPAGESLCAAPSYQQDAVAVSDGALGMIVAWQDSRGAGDIYAQRVAGDGPTPTLMSLASALARPDRVTLIWHSVEGSLSDAAVYRRREGEAWLSLGRALFDDMGRLRFEDTSVAPGSRYAYRLGWSESGADRYSAETWVEVPAALTLALEGARPNPAAGPFSVAFTLPGAEPATVEMLDVAGRQVLKRDVGGLGPGAHVIRLGERGSTLPGMYWLRLSQSGRSLIRRVVVVQ